MIYRVLLTAPGGRMGSRLGSAPTLESRTIGELQTGIDVAMTIVMYTDAEIVAAIERALDEAEREAFEIDFAEGSQPQIATFSAVEENFFAEGEALCREHREEAAAIARRQASATTKRSWLGRIFSRSRMPTYA